MAHNNGSSLKRGLLRPGVGGSRIPFFIIIALSILCAIMLYNVYTGAARKTELQEELDVMRVKNHMCNKDKLDTEKKYEMLSKTMKQKSESDLQKIKSMKESNAELVQQLKTVNDQVTELKDSKKAVDDQLAELTEAKDKIVQNLTETLVELTSLRSENEKLKEEKAELSKSNAVVGRVQSKVQELRQNVQQENQDTLRQQQPNVPQQNQGVVQQNPLEEKKANVQQPAVNVQQPAVNVANENSNLIGTNSPSVVRQPQENLVGNQEKFKEPVKPNVDATFVQPKKFEIENAGATDVEPPKRGAVALNNNNGDEKIQSDLSVSSSTAAAASNLQQETEPVVKKSRKKSGLREKLLSTLTSLAPAEAPEKVKSANSPFSDKESKLNPPGSPSATIGETDLRSKNVAQESSSVVNNPSKIKAVAGAVVTTSPNDASLDAESTPISPKKLSADHDQNNASRNLLSQLPTKLNAPPEMENVVADAKSPSLPPKSNDDAEKDDGTDKDKEEDDDQPQNDPQHQQQQEKANLPTPKTPNVSLKLKSSDNKAKEDYQYKDEAVVQENQAPAPKIVVGGVNRKKVRLENAAEEKNIAAGV